MITTWSRGDDSHTKGAGMLVVSLRGVNFGFWSHLGSSGPLYVAVNLRSLVGFNSFYLKVGPRPDWSPLEV